MSEITTRNVANALPTSETMGWMEQRACIGVSPEVFFPSQGESLEVAQAICASCPVTAECLQLALDNNEQHGVWGGLSAKARGRLPRGRKPRLIATCGTTAGYARHRRMGEEPCSRCRAANATYQRERKLRSGLHTEPSTSGRASRISRSATDPQHHEEVA